MLSSLTFISLFVLPRSVNAESNSISDSSIKIPMHVRVRQLGYLSLIDAQPTVKVQVGNNSQQEKLFFRVDTGCTDTMIDTQAAKRLGLIVGNEAITVIGAHSQFVAYKSNLPLLKLGPIREHNLPVQVTDLSKTDSIGNTEGILGVDFWKKYVLTLNYRENEIELNSLYPDKKKKKEVWVIPALNSKRGRFYLNGTVNGTHNIRMLVDTCSPTTNIPYDQAKEIFGDKIADLKFGNIDYDVNGGKAKVATIHTESFQLGDFACTGLILYVIQNNGEGSTDCIIGDDFLRNYCVSFDFPAQRLILQK